MRIVVCDDEPLARERLVRIVQESGHQVVAQATTGAEAIIAARTHRGVELIKLKDIYYFTADQKYVKVRHKDGIVLIDETLKELEQEFEDRLFRVHRNAIINLSFLDFLETLDAGQYQIRFKGIDETLAVSRRHLPALRDKIQSM